LKTLPELYEQKKIPCALRRFRSSCRSSRIALDFFDISPHGRLLDIGAWDGSMRKILPDAIQYYPLDINKINQPNALVCDLNKKKIPFNDGYFDYVFANHVIEHLFYPEEIMKEIYRVMKLDGKAMIGVPNEDGFVSRVWSPFRKYDTIEDQVFQHHWFFTHRNMVKFIDQCGFRIVKCAGRFGLTSPHIIRFAPMVFYKVVKKWYSTRW